MEKTENIYEDFEPIIVESKINLSLELNSNHRNADFIIIPVDTDDLVNVLDKSTWDPSLSIGEKIELSEVDMAKLKDYGYSMYHLAEKEILLIQFDKTKPFKLSFHPNLFRALSDNIDLFYSSKLWTSIFEIRPKSITYSICLDIMLQVIIRLLKHIDHAKNKINLSISIPPKVNPFEINKLRSIFLDFTSQPEFKNPLSNYKSSSKLNYNIADVKNIILSAKDKNFYLFQQPSKEITSQSIEGLLHTNFDNLSRSKEILKQDNLVLVLKWLDVKWLY